MTSKQPTKLRFTQSMPKPLMVAFFVFVLAAVGVTIAILVTSGSDTIALQDRRPPPRATFSHDAGAIVPAPLGSVVPTLPPACPEVRRARLVAGGDGVVRLRQVLTHVCRLAGGAGKDVSAAARALGGVTIRFGRFDLTGVESTADFATKTIWLNIKFSLSTTPHEHLVPVLLHDAWHIGRPEVPITAFEELLARRVEVAACRQVIPLDDWPRWCEDARELTELPAARAIEILRRAGFAGS